MSPDNTVADRLVADDRRHAAAQDSTGRGRTAMIIGIVALVVSPIGVLGWIIGAAAVGVGAVSLRRPGSSRQARIAVILGLAAIVVATFFETLSISLS